jgi:hypothetical protein
MNPQYGTTMANAARANANFSGSPSMGQGNDAQIQNIQNLAQIDFRAGGSGRAMGAFGGEAANTADREEAARRAAQAAAEHALKLKTIQMEKDAALNDPKNYIRSVSADGGYNFYKPDGTPISVQEYSQVTGKQIDKALEGSNNPKDQEFGNSYKALMNYGRAMAGDDDAVTAFKDSKEGKSFLSKPENKEMPFADVVRAFNKNYSNYMQPSQGQAILDRGKNYANQAITNQGNWAGANWLRGIANPAVKYRG